MRLFAFLFFLPLFSFGFSDSPVASKFSFLCCHQYRRNRESSHDENAAHPEIGILGGNDHEENTNIVAMSFTYGLNHGLWYTVNKAD